MVVDNRTEITTEMEKGQVEMSDTVQGQNTHDVCYEVNLNLINKPVCACIPMQEA